MSHKRRPLFSIAATLALFILPGCTREDAGSDPAVQFRQVASEVQNGKLTAAYDALLPASYDAQLNALLSEVGALFDRHHFDQMRDALRSAGSQFGTLLALSAKDTPALVFLGSKLGDLPALLGISTYEDFRSLNSERLLNALDAGLFRGLMELDAVKDHLGTIEVKLKERKRDWARIEVKVRPKEGEVREEVVEIIRVGDRWVPVEWVTDWPNQFAALRQKVAAAAQLKTDDPKAFEEKWQAIHSSIRDPIKVFQNILPELSKAFGVAGAGGVEDRAGAPVSAVTEP